MNTRHDDDYNFVFKIILLGDTNVGKTHLLSRYIKGQLPKQKGPTIGVEFATKPVPLKTGGTVRVQIWDTGKSLNIFRQVDHLSMSDVQKSLTDYLSNLFCILVAGQERFKAITSAHYRKSLGALLVYDITKE